MLKNHKIIAQNKTMNVSARAGWVSGRHTLFKTFFELKTNFLSIKLTGNLLNRAQLITEIANFVLFYCVIKNSFSKLYIPTYN